MGRGPRQEGIGELHGSQALQRVGYLSAKIDQMTYRMSFDVHTRSGTVVVNTALVDPRVLLEHAGHICEVFARGYAMGACLCEKGEQIGDVIVPEGQVGFCTVCSVTLNGVLLKHGISTASRFGGLLQLRDGLPTRFVEVVHYDGTGIDPLEVFIRSGMTDYHGAIRTGDGLIGASFREMPGDARPLVAQLGEHLAAVGLGAISQIGLPGQPVLDVSVSWGRFGVVVIGGLNPVGILEGAGHRTPSRALCALMEFNRLFPYDELPDRLRAIVSRMKTPATGRPDRP